MTESNSTEKPRKRNRRRAPFPCIVCGKEYMRPINACGDFQKAKRPVCSETCRSISFDGREALFLKKVPCQKCGKEFTPVTTKHKFCSRDCHYQHVVESYVPATPHNKKCVQCGSPFTSHAKRALVCSPECKLERAKETEAFKRSRRTRDARRRALKRTPDAEKIDPYKVFSRDKWVCYICGSKTERDKRGTTHPLAPELEHIVALAAGGTHTWDNVACACRKCNREKGTADYSHIFKL